MRRALALVTLWLVCASTQAAVQGVKTISPTRLDLEGGELAIGLSQDWQQPLPEIQRALIIVHGRLRNAQTYLHSAEQAASQAGQSATTLVIAPQFLNQRDIARHRLPASLLRWQGNDWMAGEPSSGPRPQSSYAVLDAIITRLSDRQQFPSLTEIVIAGHSGGAQVVQRFALLGLRHPGLEDDGIKLRYVIANPSSYAYFDEQRPVKVDAGACPGFNHWKYGLLKRPAYAAGQTAQQLEQRYVKRDITYLLGKQDTDPHHPALDTRCAAEAQGAYRLIRGHNYFDYLKQRHPQGLQQQLIEVPGVGHDGDKMFTSPEGQKALFGQ
ncbi:alpha/beta hydrolase [Pseudomonas sp. SK3(2021)]|uniref:alpha/beta hydrolase n=1 Tax=Pseudomonas sp. SK3(2021) TaxID=2841064 RepID=UPI00192B565D|nr:alpha/beta hydrolase [Pseudomonas sp. SK3(2021)]QQZ41399.1 alpha/beta hydrolase [Pseudomonas sp. SK3(2021)]